MNDNKDAFYRPITLLELSEAAKKRVALISKEFTDGFEFIKNYPRSVTFFGSARTKEGEYDYERARNLAKRIVEELHYSVLTGGGPGIMEAANRGAYEAGGNSLGLNIGLPHEQLSNKYLTHEIGFHYFFSRKVCLSFSAEAYVFFPGGFGTLDEFLEILTLVQTNKIPKVPIILFGESYWKPLEEFFKKNLLPGNMIEETDLNLYLITDDEDKMLDTIRHAPVRIGLKYDEKSEDPQRSNGKKGNAEGPLTSLSEKHCIPCEGDVSPFSREESEKFLKEVNEWTLVEDREIEKTYEFKDFSEALSFVNKVGKIAENEGHHPDIKLHDFRKVDIKISTHAIDGLSENDFILASKIDQIVRENKF
ncbi:MAG TPA: TIGR00730 family Rossman fold protein [Candidatus Paceibacterota bacterium]